jgi:hypothetical protein
VVGNVVHFVYIRLQVFYQSRDDWVFSYKDKFAFVFPTTMAWVYRHGARRMAHLVNTLPRIKM